MNTLSWSDYLKLGLPEGYITFLRPHNGAGIDKVHIFKKRTGWDNTPMWLMLERKDDIFQWVHIRPHYHPEMLINKKPLLAQVVEEEDLRWNFILREQLPEVRTGECATPVDLKFFSGPWNHLNFQIHIYWDGFCLRWGFTDEYNPQEFTYEFYSNAYPLTELPDSTISQELVEGWTHLEDSDEDRCVPEDYEEEEEEEEEVEEEDYEDNNVEEDKCLLLEVSIQALIDENKSLKEVNNKLKEEETELREKIKEASREKVKGYFNQWKENVSDNCDDEDDYDAYAEEIYQERRIDPFDKEMYTKEEFQEYYGYDGFGDAMWDMNHPDKVSKVLTYEWVLSRNKDVLNTKNKNYIMDKMIEVLCS
jgi:hypothetical protein